MDWQQYEREIEEQFRQAYPSAQVTHDAKLVGKFSKVERQIDLLIEEHASDFALRIVVDAKYRGRKIDVSDVEAFIGLTRDVEAHTGMMVALEGYTPAAVSRAHNDDLDMILDVLNFEDLKAFQGPTAIPYSGEHGVWIAAPFGWIVDATKRPHTAASLYQRGLTFEEAVRSDEWMYVNFWDKRDHKVNNLDALLKYQETYMLEGSPDAEIRILEEARNQRVGVKTLIRRFKKKTYPAPEYAGFVDFENFLFMCVLFTPERLERKNLRKLRFVIRDAFPMKVTHDHTAQIKGAEAKLKGALPIEARAKLLSKIGFWHREMGELKNSRVALEECLSLVPNSYYALQQLRATLMKLGDRDAMLESMGRLLRLDPHNPTVFDECIEYTGSKAINCSDLLALLEALKNDYPEDQLVQANADFYAGKILIDTEPTSARKHIVLAQASFRKLFPRGHQVFAVTRSALRQLSQKKRGIPPSKTRGQKTRGQTGRSPVF
jgi:tetratricopeptide (TPR) repeat protein